MEVARLLHLLLVLPIHDLVRQVAVEAVQDQVLLHHLHQEEVAIHLAVLHHVVAEVRIAQADHRVAALLVQVAEEAAEAVAVEVDKMIKDTDKS